MSAIYRSLITVPIPAPLGRDEVVDTIHTFTVICSSQAFVISTKRVPVNLSDVDADLFFEANGGRIERYHVVERVPILKLSKKGTVYKNMKIDVTFQSFDGGARSRADAGGVRIYATHYVRSRAPSIELDDASGAEWELVEKATVKCNRLTKPFVKRKYDEAHRELLTRILNTTEKNKSVSASASASVSTSIS